MDRRLQALQSWINTIPGLREAELRPASTDASFRRYFRVRAGDRTYVAMDAPPDKYDPHSYVRIAERFYALGLHVPRVLEKDLARGFFLITDLGERLYLSELNDETVERLYGDALSALVVLQAGIYTDPGFLPEYDEALLLAEMELFREWYLGRHLGITLRHEQQQVLGRMFGTLARSALKQSKTWVHRDYHSRNLMVVERNSPGILDFQDAVCGPVSYDLVSLLRDCYIAWPRARVEQWVVRYHDLALESGIPVCDDPQQFQEWFDLMGVQRHLKAVGIFARLWHRDGKSGYLDDIPRTLGYVLDVSARYSALQPLHELLCDLELTDAANGWGVR